jgi:hypothetical protein
MKLDLNDIFIIVGGICFGIGTYMIYPPATFILLGLGLLYLGFIGAGERQVKQN